LPGAPGRLILAAMDIRGGSLAFTWRRQAAELPRSVERVRVLADRPGGDRYAAGSGRFPIAPESAM